MKIKITILTLSAIIALAMMPIFAISQNDDMTPDAVSSFSTFSAPQNMGATLNSADNDQAPLAAPSGLSLYFTSDRPGGQGDRDIWVSQRPTLTSAWGAPQNLGATVNSISSDVVSSFSRDGREMFLQSQRSGGMGAQDIYISTRTDPNNDFGWTTPVNIGAVINTTAGEIGAAYFEDLTTGVNTLFFASDRNQNPNDFYLFRSTRNADGTFNPPVLVNELNSVESAQLRPSIRRDGLEIFFGSIRPGGLTFLVFDIWVSTRASTTSPWSPPVLVSGINSLEEDRLPSLSPDGSILYFDSTRPGGSGGFDLYSTTRVSVNRSSTADFDGDGRSDISVFRPSDGTWYLMQSGTNTVRTQKFGLTGDKIVPGDYDGDGRNDLAVFRPSDRNWYIQRSSDSQVSITNWGLGTDKLVPGDYDGDGKTDIAVYRSGIWYIIQSSNGAENYQFFGLGSDIPVAGANSQ